MNQRLTSGYKQVQHQIPGRVDEMANGNSEPWEHRHERNHYFDVLLNTAERLNWILIFSQLEVHIDLIYVVKIFACLDETLLGFHKILWFQVCFMLKTQPFITKIFLETVPILSLFWYTKEILAKFFEIFIVK